MNDYELIGRLKAAQLRLETLNDNFASATRFVWETSHREVDECIEDAKKLLELFESVSEAIKQDEREFMERAKKVGVEQAVES